ncbi:MAG TPA: hypothetical protein VGQ39_17305 [Pyrinomonadaceae bacterium]|jgi:hypothetical protein|nr:hypothetical protein [Pyrinomonadaceae bacterium]
MNEFRFENSLTMTESQYLAVWALLPAHRLARIIRLGALTAVGVVFLFTPYTLLLGVLILGVVGLYLFLPRLIPAGTRSLFRQHRYLRDVLTYGVSDQKLWVKGARLDANVSWSMLVTWREREGWLVLSPSGIPPVYLSLARLREEGLYDQVKNLATRNANEFKTSGYMRAI